ncbi:hypothetical protein NGM37_22220, partial [Streptomyces sp. TRM76130]|nr:hypothetical protein [Streptomyces sp. TRM76130]
MSAPAAATAPGRRHHGLLQPATVRVRPARALVPALHRKELLHHPYEHLPPVRGYAQPVGDLL